MKKRKNMRNPLFLPVGAFWANWSKVKQLPPAAKILFLADSVNLKAQTLSLGTSKSLLSSTTVQTATTVFFSCFPLRFLTIRETLIGYLVTLVCFSLFKTTALNLALVLLAKNLYNYSKKTRFYEDFFVFLYIFYIFHKKWKNI